jgi:hypothetical protein
MRTRADLLGRPADATFERAGTLTAARMSALQLVELELGDAPAAWRAAGFTVDADDAVRVGGVVLRCAGGADGEGGIRGWTIRGVADAASIDGLPGRLADAPEASEAVAPVTTVDAEARRHPNTSVALDHLVITTPDSDRTVAAFQAQGCEPRRERIAGAGPRAMRQTFFRASTTILEVVGPAAPPADAARRARPATLWGLAFTVRDLDACAALLGDALTLPKDAVQQGRRIATLRHDAIGGSIPTVFMSGAPAAEPRASQTR